MPSGNSDEYCKRLLSIDPFSPKTNMSSSEINYLWNNVYRYTSDEERDRLRKMFEEKNKD